MRDAIRRWSAPLLMVLLFATALHAPSCGAIIGPIIADPPSTVDEEALELPDRYEVDAETSALLDVCDRHDLYVISDVDLTRLEKDVALQASQRLRNLITGSN